MEKKIKNTILGGTFDRLHRGHKEFILYGISLSEKVFLGLTSDSYVAKTKKNIESFRERKKAIEDFLKAKNLLSVVEIVSIDDIYGIATSRKHDLNALIAVEKTLKGANKVNEKRKELGLAPLQIIISSSVVSQDGKVLSSSRIRDGEIDRDGNLYIKPEWLERNLMLPENLRKELKKPWGEIVSSLDMESLSEILITVGDITTKKFKDRYINPKIAIVDFNVNREKKFDDLSDLGFAKNEHFISVENNPGEISKQLFNEVVRAFRKNGNFIIKIDGEEDLSVLPIILAAPLGADIFYGQPNKGLIRITVQEELKNDIRNLVCKFNLR